MTDRGSAAPPSLLQDRLVDLVADLVFVHAPDGRIVDVNAEACRRTGYRRDELLQMTIPDIDPTWDAPLVPGFFDRVAQEGYTGESMVRRRDGSIFPVEVRAKWTEREGVPHLVAAVRDITSRKAAERRLRESERLQSLGVLSGAIAHDFNNLLVGVLGHADIALHRLEGQAEVREALHSIVRAATRAADSAAQLLALSGGRAATFREVNVEELVLADETRVGLRWGEGTQLAIEPSSTSARCYGDPAQLRQLFVHLIQNGLDAVAGEGGQVRVSMRMEATHPQEQPGTTMLNHLEEGGAVVAVTIDDDGPGMDAETRERALEPLFTTRVERRGLGLAASAGIVRGHRGALVIASRPGLGTSATVYLPVAHAKDDARRSPPEIASPRRRVLVVDDEAAVRGVVSELLQANGYEVDTAGDGNEALARAAEAAYSLVLMDVVMPGLDGREAAERLHTEQPDLPIVMMSGYQTETQSVSASVVGFLHKPFRAVALLEIVGEFAVADASEAER